MTIRVRAMTYRRNQTVDLIPNQVDDNFMFLDNDLTDLATTVQNLNVSDIAGAAPSSNPTFTGTVSADLFSGSGANLNSIPNVALSNSTITLGATSIALGDTTQNLVGLSSVTSTIFVGNMTGTASNAAQLNNQPAAFYTTTSNITEGSNLYFTTARVLATTLDYFVAKPGTVADTDSILSALEKLEYRTAINDTKVTYPGLPSFSQLTSTPTTLAGYGITDAAWNGQTFYLGYTPIAINRTSGVMALTGITSIDGNAATVTTNANLSGDVSSIGNTTSILASTIMAKALAGYTVGPVTPLAATDSIGTAFGKLQAQVNSAAAPRSITLSGDISGSGTAGITATLINTGVTAGTYNAGPSTITPFTVDAKGRVTGTGNPVAITLNWSSILATPTTLSGFGITDGVNINTVGSANGVASLDATGKIPNSQLPAAVLGNMNYQGVWNASTNSPQLVSGVGTKGWYYKVGVAGTTSVDTISQWNVGDMIVYDGSVWDKIDGLPSEVSSVAGRIGAVTLSVSDISGAAPVASPGFTGIPTAPTAVAGTSSTQLATTAFVMGLLGTAAPLMDGLANVGTSLLWTRQDHVHPIDTSRAPLASPAFTGTPTAPTPAFSDSSTTLATTAYVKAQGYLTSTPVTSVFGRTGAVVLSAADVTTALTFTPYDSANPAGFISAITSTMVKNALGYTPYNATNPSAYISGITSTMVTSALGFTPYNASNPSAYISGITSTMVTSALGFTPYNATNPAGYQTATQVAASTVANSAAIGGFGTGNVFLRDASFPNNRIHSADGTSADTPFNGNTFNYGTGTGTPFTGVIASFGGLGSNNYALQLQSQYSGSSDLAFRTRNGDAGTWNAWRTTVHSGNIAYQSVNYATTAGTASTANSVAWGNVSGKPNVSALNFAWNWSGQGGQPPWLWGGSDGTNMYVYNPSNFSVNYANTAGSATYATTAGSAPANGGTSTSVVINYNNGSNSTYQVLWGSGNNVYGNSNVYVNPAYGYVYATEFIASGPVQAVGGLAQLVSRGNGSALQVRDTTNGLNYQLYVEGGVIKLIQV